MGQPDSPADVNGCVRNQPGRRRAAVAERGQVALRGQSCRRRCRFGHKGRSAAAVEQQPQGVPIQCRRKHDLVVDILKRHGRRHAGAGREKLPVFRSSRRGEERRRDRRQLGHGFERRVHRQRQPGVLDLEMARHFRAVFHGVAQHRHRAGQPAFVLHGLLNQKRLRVQINGLRCAVFRLDIQHIVMRDGVQSGPECHRCRLRFLRQIEIFQRKARVGGALGQLFAAENPHIPAAVLLPGRFAVGSGRGVNRPQPHFHAAAVRGRFISRHRPRKSPRADIVHHRVRRLVFEGGRRSRRRPVLRQHLR